MAATAVGDVALEALHKAMALKSETVARDGLGTDVGILLDLRREGLLLGVLALERDERRQDLATAATVVSLSDADQVTYIADAFQWRAPAGTPYPGPLEPGCLARWFAEGCPHVSEALTASSRRADGESAGAVCVYRYEGRRVVWDPPATAPDWVEQGGDVPDALDLGFQAQAVRPVPALSVAAIAVQLELVAATPVLRRPPRNGPCPCGSGQKAKLCCWAATS
jgi:hypothetical protein